jgi:hypothetical protein
MIATLRSAPMPTTPKAANRQPKPALPPRALFQEPSHD